jgi:hypothetical protein
MRPIASKKQEIFSFTAIDRLKASFGLLEGAIFGLSLFPPSQSFASAATAALFRALQGSSLETVRIRPHLVRQISRYYRYL